MNKRICPKCKVNELQEDRGWCNPCRKLYQRAYRLKQRARRDAATAAASAARALREPAHPLLRPRMNGVDIDRIHYKLGAVRKKAS
jgi:hypothetical protein